MSKLAPDRMSQNKSLMTAILLQEKDFFCQITLSDEEAEQVRERERNWPLEYVRRKLGTCNS
jgi:hypothetical protein